MLLLHGLPESISETSVHAIIFSMSTTTSNHHPLIIAHRGASAFAPENTMAAFRLAKELGADGIELDVMLSADQKLVVHHDNSVNRTTDGKGTVAEMTWDELKDLDAGSKFGEDFSGEPLPLLEQVFEELGRKLLINVELKNYASPRDSLTEMVVDLVKRMELEESVLLSSFNATNLLRAYSAAPEIRRGLLTLPGLAGSLYRGWYGRRFQYDALHPYFLDVKPKLVERLHKRGKQFRTARESRQGMLSSPALADNPLRHRHESRFQYDALHPHYPDVRPKMVEKLHKHGKQVNVWTVDEPEDLRRMKAYQVDSVICNDPAQARQVLETP